MKRLKRLEPLMPLVALTPGSHCPHGVEIRVGWCCVVCHRSGSDGHPDLIIDPQERPAPEKKIVPTLLAKHLTRKEARKRMFQKG